ncbi:MAG: NAD dependent epimerase/dehydratase [Kiritimatiellia bacterium]|jgi:NAD dependent epimerase/dehydratase
MSLSGKKVLVTGAGGFIGSHLAERLVAEGAQVRALVHYNAVGSWGWLDESPLRTEMEVMAGDITDALSVRQAVEGCDTVFHLAALIAIPYSYAAPASYIRTNIEGTMNVLNAVRDCGARRVLHTSTSEVYGTAIEVPITENHPLQGQSPYSASKIGADKIAEAYFCSFETPVVTIRPFNTFGPRQSARAVIPTIISQCLAGYTEIKLGNQTPTRDLNYVANTVDGFIKAATADAARVLGGTFNLGTGREISIGDLARTIIAVTGVEAKVVTDEQRLRPEASEVERLLADARLAFEAFGWQAEIDLETGLAETVEWLRNHQGRYRPEQYTV